MSASIFGQFCGEPDLEMGDLEPDGRLPGDAQGLGHGFEDDGLPRRACGSRRRRPSAAATRLSSMSSSVEAKLPGVYSRPEDRPRAPPAMASATRAFIRSSSAADGGPVAVAHGRGPDGAVADEGRVIERRCRTARGAARKPRMSRQSASSPYSSASRRRMSSASSSVSGNGEPPHWPLTRVVTPCRTALSAWGLTRSPVSVWSWTSMKPGETARPSASITAAARDRRIRPIEPDRAARDAHVRPDGRPARAVVDRAAGDEQVEVLALGAALEDEAGACRRTTTAAVFRAPWMKALRFMVSISSAS